MNRLVEWSDELKTGIAEIDAQHEVFAGLINELHEAVYRRRGVGACREALQRLCDHARSQLGVEEMTSHDGEGHVLVKQLEQMLEGMDDDNSNITFHGLHQLKFRLLNHVREVRLAVAAATTTETATEGLKVFGLLLKRA